MKPKIVAIVGPTASGKSDLAVVVAKKFNGEVISADSRQVYKGLDIGTGKITKKEMRGVPHHLLDVANPKTQFSVDKYKELADKAITNILAKGRIPILCGGTGFYVDAVAKNISLPNVPPNPKLRKILAKKSASTLFTMLRKLDPNRAKSIQKENKVRLIRALEICKSIGHVPHLEVEPPSKYEVLYIGILWKPRIHKEKIRARLLKRMNKGMIAEAKRLHKQGLSWKRMHALGLEYHYLALYLQKQISKNEMIEKLNSSIWHYAKRQMTWFKRNKDIVWMDPQKKSVILKVIQKFLK
ncbi:MAG TPA: tRNA (adenosine(37)-N6)-dimethylallyltransferase MiaA [Candidatus Paceibacterota bacterium]